MPDSVYAGFKGETPNKSLHGKWHRPAVPVISATRREANMTQDHLANRLGWHRRRIAKIEADVVELIAIAGALEVEPELLFGRVVRW